MLVCTQVLWELPWYHGGTTGTTLVPQRFHRYYLGVMEVLQVLPWYYGGTTGGYYLGFIKVLWVLP